MGDNRSAGRAWLLAMLALCCGGLAAGASMPNNQPSVAGRQATDAERGLDYILNGDYIGSGIPRSLWDNIMRLRDAGPLAIERFGSSAGLPHDLNGFTSPEGVEVVAGANCLACHAQMFDGELVIGLGNSLNDWTTSNAGILKAFESLGRFQFAQGSPERIVFDRFLRGTKALEGHIQTPFRGVNPAFRLEEVAASWRNPADLEWMEAQGFEPVETFVASDTPPLWHVHKKQSLYYNGMGRGDFRRLVQQIMVVGIDDATHAAAINENMDDVVAYLESLRPPPYPGEIDPQLAELGMEVFETNCASCHGTYGASWRDDDPAWTYPNRLVPAEEVGTDPLYAEMLRQSELWKWYNDSWFAAGQGEDASYAQPKLAYVAPPLDGVWITAPYLHNGSVPTLAALLDSSRRPTYWSRSFRSDDYDLDQLGWQYRSQDAPDGAPKTYNTTVPGYGNGGHTYGDDLTEGQRAALLEYLKSL